MSLHTEVKGQFGLGTGRTPGKALKNAMFLGRPWRKKRALLLSSVRTPKKKPPAMSQWCPPVHSVQGRNHQWYEACYRGHAAYCGCGNFINLLVALGDQFGFRPGPRAPGAPGLGGPPVLPRRALPAPPAEAPEHHQGNNNNNQQLQRWPGDGGNADGADGGEASGGDAALPEDDLDGLLAALDDEE